ncbi:MAG: TIGR02996 domain-containing protein [Myxococcus sp.]|nr:TIGR02996 domain-containing protein [Myxococcus sp.]
MAARKQKPKPPTWDELAGSRDDAHVGALVAQLEDTSAPKLEARFLSLATWPKTPVFAAAAASYLRRFPLRFREQLGTGVAALGVFIVHEGQAAALEPLEVVDAPNDVVPAWRDQVVEATRTFLGRAPTPVPPGRVPSALPRGPRDALQAAWLELAATRSSGAVALLLERLAEGPGVDVTARARALLAFPPDPRIAAAAAGLITRPIVRVDASNPLFVMAALLLLAHGDASHLPAARALAEQVPGFGWLELVAPTHAPPSRAPVVERATPASEADFLEWLAKAPADLARRHAFADWLLEGGDPRGEFMALQLAARALTPKASARVTALQKKHQKHWLRSFWKSVVKGSAVFSRGVLSSVGLSSWGPGGTLPRPDEPQLATLERLSVTGGQSVALAALLGSPLLMGLRELRLQAVMLPAVPTALLARLEVLGLLVQWAPAAFSLAPASALLDAMDLRSVRKVSLGDNLRADEAALVRAATWLRGRDALQVDTNAPDAWFAAVRAHGLSVVEVRQPSHLGQARWCFTRDADAWRLDVSVAEEKDVAFVVEVLGRLEPALLRATAVALAADCTAAARKELASLGVQVSPT